MSDRIINDLMKNPVVLGVACVVIVVLIIFILRSPSAVSEEKEIKEIKETFINTFSNPTDTFSMKTITEHDKEIIEYFPSAEMNVMYSDANGNLATTRDLGLSNITVSGDSQFGRVKIMGTTTIDGAANIHAGSPYSVPNGKMAAGSLTIGDNAKDYGGGTSGWNTNTAGLMMECKDNTEIAIHDSGLRVASAMYYDGAANKITVGRNMGWGNTNVSIPELTSGTASVTGALSAGSISTPSISTPELTRTSGDWLRINNAAGTVGRTALYGNLSVNSTQAGHGGLSVGYWDDAGDGNIKASGTITAAGALTAGSISTPELTRTSGDWLRINNAAGTVGRTALYGNLSVNSTQEGHGGLSVGYWDDAGDGNIKASGTIAAAGALTAGSISTQGNLTVYRAGDTNKGITLTANNADGASYTNYNGGIASWNGLGVKCLLDNTTRHIFDTRTGDLSMKGALTAGSITVNGKIYAKGDIGADSNGVEFRHSNETQGIGIGYNSVYATGTNANQDISIKSRGNGKAYINGRDILAELDSLKSVLNSSAYTKVDNFVVNGSSTRDCYYVKFPGRLIVQKGTTWIGTGTFTYVTYPIPFTNMISKKINGCRLDTFSGWYDNNTGFAYDSNGGSGSKCDITWEVWGTY